MTFLSAIIIAFIGGAIIGFLIGRKRSKFDGIFIVDDADYETTRWTLDMKIDPKTIPNRKEIRLKVGKMFEGDV